MEIRSTALAHAGLAVAEHRVANRSAASAEGRAGARGAPGPDRSLLAARRPRRHQFDRRQGRQRSASTTGPTPRSRASPTRSPSPSSTNGDVDPAHREGTHERLRAGFAPTLGLLSAACEFAFSLAPGAGLAVVVSSPMRDGVEPRAEASFDALRDAVAQDWRAKIGPRKITVGDQEVSDTVEAQTAFILVNSTEFAFKPGPRNYDRTWIRDGSAQALALLWAGLVEEAKAYVVWYSKRIYKNGMVPPILNVDGTVNRGYGSDIEFDGQGEFVGIAADVYRISRDRAFLSAIFEPVVRATRFIEELCARTDAEHGSETRFHGLLAPSISHEGYSKPSYSYWDDYFALSAWRNCEFLAHEIGDKAVAAHAKAKGREFAANLTRSIRMTAEKMKTGLIPGSADRDDIDPTATSIAFEPCRVEDALPPELVEATYDRAAARVRQISSPDFKSNYSPYDLRNLNAFVSLGRCDDAFRLLSVMLACRRPPRLARMGRGRMGRYARAGIYRRHAPHLDRRRVRLRRPAHAAEGKRTDARTLPRRARRLVGRRGYCAQRAADGLRRRQSKGAAGATARDGRPFRRRSCAQANPRPLSGGEARLGGRPPVRNPGRRHHEHELEPARNRLLTRLRARVALDRLRPATAAIASSSHPSLFGGQDLLGDFGGSGIPCSRSGSNFCPPGSMTRCSLCG